MTVQFNHRTEMFVDGAAGDYPVIKKQEALEVITTWARELETNGADALPDEWIEVTKGLWQKLFMRTGLRPPK
jgi:hypothetical protein